MSLQKSRLTGFCRYNKRMAGRPTKPDKERRTAPEVRIRVNEDEKDKIVRAAAIARPNHTGPGGGAMSAWARDILLKEAEKLLKS